jgi:hypothetical protein
VVVQELERSTPPAGGPAPAPIGQPAVVVDGISKRFVSKPLAPWKEPTVVTANADVSFSVARTRSSASSAPTAPASRP